MKEKHRIAFLATLCIVYLSISCAAYDWYDSDITDNSIWTHRMWLNFTDRSNYGCKFSTTIKLSQIFGEGFNYSTINMNSIRVVDPDMEGDLNSKGGAVLKYQLDYISSTPGDSAVTQTVDNQMKDFYEIIKALRGESTNQPQAASPANKLDYFKNSELSFIIDVPASTTKTYFVYYSTDNSINPINFTTDLNFSMDKSTVVVENNKAEFGGFKNGYLGLYNYKNKMYGSNIAYPEIGLDSGFSIETPTEKIDFPRYDKYWECQLMSSGPVRIQVKCNASNMGYNLEKVFSFYSGLPFYTSKNTISTASVTNTQVKWNIYSVLKPYFIKKSNMYVEYSTGVEESKSCYVTAKMFKDNEAKNYFFMIAGKGDMDCMFLEDRETDYELFSVVLNTHGKTKATGETLYLFYTGGYDTAREEYFRFTIPPKTTSALEVNKMTITTPNSQIFYDILYNKSATIPIEVTNLHGSNEAYCDILDPYGDVVHSEVPLYNDGSHGDATANDDTWTNNETYVIKEENPTGAWMINCTEAGSQSVKTTASSEFFVTYDYNYRRLNVCDTQERYVKIRPGENLQLDFCVENTGGRNESRIRITTTALPDYWSTNSSEIPELPRGQRTTVKLNLTIPLNQTLTYEKIRLNVMGEDVVRGVGSMKVEVVVPLMDIRLETYENLFGIHIIDERGIDIEGAEVIVEYPSGEENRGKTSVNGRYILTHSETGLINIKASKEGYNPREIKITIEGEEQTIYMYMTIILLLIVIAILYVRALKTKKQAK
ncbi:MAG: hypothetical protein V1703_03495 [Candidatus Altiarchaeota archaeon]